MQIRLGFSKSYGDVPSQHEGVIEIHVQVLAIGLHITFPWLHKPINAEIILLWIDTIQ
jgi:hypothetical protein